MASLNLLEILNKAYQHTKNHKFLWFFGFLMSFEAGLDFNRSRTYSSAALSAKEKISYFSHNPAAFLLLTVAVILVVSLYLFVIAVCRSALIYSALHLERKEEFGLKEVLKKSKSARKRVWYVQIYTTSVIVLSLFVLGSGVYYAGMKGANIYPVGTAALLLFLIILSVLSIVNVFASCFIVVYNFKYQQAMRSAFDLLSRFWVDSYIMFFGLLISYLLLIFMFAGLISIAGLLAISIGLLLKSVSVALLAALAWGIIAFTLFAIIIFAHAAFNVYTNIAWTIFYLRFVKAMNLPQEAMAYGDLLGG